MAGGTASTVTKHTCRQVRNGGGVCVCIGDGVYRAWGISVVGYIDTSGFTSNVPW